MAVVELSYPVTGSAGSYKNIFPSQKPLYANFERKDALIDTMTSGVDGFLRITISGTFENVSVGQNVIFQSGGYSLRSARVVSVVSASVIEVDVQFTSSNASNGFVNYHLNWFLEIRYVAKDSDTDDQDAIEIIEDYSQIPSDLSGLIRANISTPADLLNPEIDLSREIQEGLFQEYKIQYRESYKGQRSLPWVSPALDIHIMLIHSTVDLNNGFTDSELTKKYYKGYPLIYSLVYSSVNDTGINRLPVGVFEYRIDKSFIKINPVTQVFTPNGVYMFQVDGETLDDETVFVSFFFQLLGSTAQYDPTHYDPTQYA